MAANFNRSEDFKILMANFNLLPHIIKKPEMTDSKDKFYKVYSPLKLKLRPTDDIYLDLNIDIQTPETLQLWSNLLPSLKEKGLDIETDVG